MAQKTSCLHGCKTFDVYRKNNIRPFLNNIGHCLKKVGYRFNNKPYSCFDIKTQPPLPNIQVRQRRLIWLETSKFPYISIQGYIII